MSIETTDILFKLASTTGPGDANTSSPAGSLGGYVSTTEIVSDSLHNLFDFVSGDDNLNMVSDYRCLFIHNNNATDTFLNVKAFIFDQAADGADAFMGVDPTAASAVDSTSAQAEVIVDETTAPSGVSFSQPSDYASGLSLGDIGPGQVKAIWFRRDPQNSPAMPNDSVTFRVQGETL